MRQFIAIAGNGFMELIRQPVFLLLMTVSSLFAVFLSIVPYFGFGDDPKLVKDSALAVMFLAGLLGAVLSASSSVAREIRSGTALAVLAKPVGRPLFLLAKFVGLAGALAVLTYVNLLSALLASRMAFDAYGEADTLAFGLFAGSLLLGYLLAAFTNYFLRRPFVADAVFFVIAIVTLGFIGINFIDEHGKLQQFGKDVDWRLIPASVLILFALWILASLALACSTRLDWVATLGICSGLFLLGLMSDYIFGRAASEGGWLASVLYTVVPNWQLFWLSDALESEKRLPWSYVGTALAYVVGYMGAALSVALMLFQDRELN